MVPLVLTPTLEATLRSLAKSLPAELAQTVFLTLDQDTTSVEQTISHEVLVRIARWASVEARVEYKSNKWTLSALLSQTDVYAPALKLPERSSELVASLAKIQLANDQASYAAMTSLAGPQHISLLPLRDIHEPRRHQTVAEEWTQVRKELSAIVNVFASMLAVGTAVWWVGGGRSYAARLSLAMSGSLAIAMIEAFLYYQFFSRASKQEPKGKVNKKNGRKGLKVLQFDPPMEFTKSQ